MARPRIFDYAPESDEPVVTQGAQGAVPIWIGLGIDNQTIHIVCNEGLLNSEGTRIETVTNANQQVSLTAQEVAEFYNRNKEAVDTILKSAMAAWAYKKGKIGNVIID